MSVNKLYALLLACSVAVANTQAMQNPRQHNQASAPAYPWLHSHTAQQQAPQAAMPHAQPQAAFMMSPEQFQQLRQMFHQDLERLKTQQEHTTQRACTSAVNKAFAKVFFGALGFYVLYQLYNRDMPQKQTQKYYARS